MIDYEELNMEIYNLIWKKYGKKYEVSYTGTIDPEYYDAQKINKASTGLDITIKVKGK